MTMGSVQFALPLDEDRPSKHIAARGCGPLAQPNARAAQKRRFLPPAYTEARFGDPTTPEEAQLYAELNRLDGLRAKVKGAEKRRLAETFREVNAKAEKLFKGRRFWGAARPLLEHAAAELGAGGRSRYRQNHGHARAAGALQTRRHCRQVQRAPADGRPHDLARAH